MTPQEIIDKLSELEITNNDLYHYVEEGIAIKIEKEDEEEVEINVEEIFGKVISVYEKGGYEGGGEEWIVVFYFELHNVYLQVDGYFDSWGNDSLNDDDLYHVIPKEVLTTIYEKP